MAAQQALITSSPTTSPTSLSKLQSALDKLTRNEEPLQLADLPLNELSSDWVEIRTTYGLTLGEVIALKNAQGKKIIYFTIKTKLRFHPSCFIF
jgi:hypothetical protein